VEGNVDDISTLKNICKSGENVEVIYDPDNPEHAVINTFAELWFAPLIMWLVGVGFVLGPPFTIWRYYKK
jgi:predicted membrane protein